MLISLWRDRHLYIIVKDGSLKLYIASELPEEAPKSNWLPLPKGKSFVMNHRLYVPKKEVLSGEYYVPEIQKVKNLPSKKVDSLLRILIIFS